MKKLFTFLSLLLLTFTSVQAGKTFTYDLGKSPGTSTPEGFFTHGTDKWNFNSKYNGGVYESHTFNSGLKMESSTRIYFTTTEGSTVTIVQSTWSSNTIKLDDNELAIADAAEGTGCRIYTVNDVPLGDHTISRGSGESGLFFIKVEYPSDGTEEYTASLTTDASWDEVYAYAWSGEGENFKEYLGSWPGTRMTGSDPYSISFMSATAPEKIQFNDGGVNMTSDLDFVNGKAYKYITATPLYAVQEGDAFDAGTTLNIKDGENVVAFLTYGSYGDPFSAAVPAVHEEYAGYTAMTEGNGVNGNYDDGTFYTIRPLYDGIITVAVFLKANKGFYVEEDGSYLPDYKGISNPVASNTSFSFEVKANSYYKFYAAGSKLGFFGFDFKYGDDIKEEYTASLTTDANWDEVYAYAWSGEGASRKEYLGSWPGTRMTGSNPYSISIMSISVPEKIQFNDGGANKTSNLGFINGKTYKYITATPLYALQEGDAFEAGTTLSIKDGDDVVALLTYGSYGDAFSAAVPAVHEEYAGYTAMTEGNGVNGNYDDGTFYTIRPLYDGTITVAVSLKANKKFFVEEDGSNLPDYHNGISYPDNVNTTFSFNVKANSYYKFYAAGSKLGFFGFDFKYGGGGSNTSTENLIGTLRTDLNINDLDDNDNTDTVIKLLWMAFGQLRMEMDIQTEENIFFSNEDKMLFTIATNGIVTVLPGVTGADNIVYTITNEDREYLKTTAPEAYEFISPYKTIELHFDVEGVEPKVEAVTFDFSEITLRPGQELQLEPHFTPAEVEDKTLRYVDVSNGHHVYIDSDNGIIFAQSEGVAYIEAFSSYTASGEEVMTTWGPTQEIYLKITITALEPGQEVFFDYKEGEGTEAPTISCHVLRDEELDVNTWVKTCEIAGPYNEDDITTLAIPEWRTGTVNLPEEAMGYEVVRVGAYSFYESQISALYIPWTVTQIGREACARCDYLTDVYIASFQPLQFTDAYGDPMEESMGHNDAFYRIGEGDDGEGYATLHVLPGSKAAWDIYPWNEWFRYIKEDTPIPVGIKDLNDSPLKGENIYNLAGQRLNEMQKGINIVNGKKVAIK